MESAPSFSRDTKGQPTEPQAAVGEFWITSRSKSETASRDRSIVVCPVLDSSIFTMLRWHCYYPAANFIYVDMIHLNMEPIRRC